MVDRHIRTVSAGTCAMCNLTKVTTKPRGFVMVTEKGVSYTFCTTHYYMLQVKQLEMIIDVADQEEREKNQADNQPKE